MLIRFGIQKSTQSGLFVALLQTPSQSNFEMQPLLNHEIQKLSFHRKLYHSEL